jgi:hypothetical protein
MFSWFRQKPRQVVPVEYELNAVQEAFAAQGFKSDHARDRELWRACCPMFIAQELTPIPHLKFFSRRSEQGIEIAILAMTRECKILDNCTIRFGQVAGDVSPVALPKEDTHVVKVGDWMRKANQDNSQKPA